MKQLPPALLLALCLVSAAAAVPLPAPKPAPRPGTQMLTDYFRAQTAELSARCLADVHTLEDWTSRREAYRRDLRDMLGLEPQPERTPLQAVVTGHKEHEGFRVENVQFQSRPGLYVTGNLYLPVGEKKPSPAILYVCGHGNVKKDGVSYGAKSHYEYHGAWLARHGYVCLIIDTLELAEIEGNHHGTFRDGLWWWMGRGFTPAGVEAWNGIRALDYLQSRPEVDPDKLGVTGRSGGGAYSWWIAALDERVKVAVPVAGITDLENHVVDGVIEGHCDCMFMVNTHRWDYAQVAALVAPRALLIENSDKDTIFPLEGVVRLHAKVRRIYQLYGAADRLGLTITEGPHKDTQELQVPALHWFNRYLKGEDPVLQDAAVPVSQPEDLRVFTTLPADQKNTQIAETFVPTAPAPTAPASRAAWAQQRDGWLQHLKDRCFSGWPAQPPDLAIKPAFTAEHEGVHLAAYDFTSQEHVPLRLYVSYRAGLDHPDLCVLNVLDEEGWKQWLAGMRVGFPKELAGEELPPADEKAFQETQAMFKQFKWAMAYIAPRGIGPTAWEGTPQKLTHLQRRFYLLGQTLDGMRVWDVRRAVQALRTLPVLKGVPQWLQGERQLAGVALYASLFEPAITRLDLWHLPHSHRDGPYFLGVQRVLDMPQAVALAAERSRVVIYQEDETGWDYPHTVLERLGTDPKHLQIRKVKP